MKALQTTLFLLALSMSGAPLFAEEKKDATPATPTQEPAATKEETKAAAQPEASKTDKKEAPTKKEDKPAADKKSEHEPEVVVKAAKAVTPEIDEVDKKTAQKPAKKPAPKKETAPAQAKATANKPEAGSKDNALDSKSEAKAVTSEKAAAKIEAKDAKPEAKAPQTDTEKKAHKKKKAKAAAKKKEGGWFSGVWVKISSFIPSFNGDSFVARWGRKFLSLFGWRPTLPLVKELADTAQKREEEFEEKHMKGNIPEDIATIAGVFNRMEDDVKKLRAAQEKTSDATYKKAYDEAIQKVDDEVDTYMAKVKTKLYGAQDKAFKAKKIALFSFIQQLLASEFMLEMLD